MFWFLDSFYFSYCLLIKKYFFLACIKKISCLFRFCLHYEFGLGIMLRVYWFSLITFSFHIYIYDLIWEMKNLNHLFILVISRKNFFCIRNIGKEKKLENFVICDYLEMCSFEIKEVQFVAFCTSKEYLLPTLIRVHWIENFTFTSFCILLGQCHNFISFTSISLFE